MSHDSFLHPMHLSTAIYLEVLQMLVSKFLYNKQKARIESEFSITTGADGKKSFACREARRHVICFYETRS